MAVLTLRMSVPETNGRCGAGPGFGEEVESERKDSQEGRGRGGEDYLGPSLGEGEQSERPCRSAMRREEPLPSVSLWAAAGRSAVGGWVQEPR